MGIPSTLRRYTMYYSTLNPIQIFRHHGIQFTSNDSAQLLYYGPLFCIVRLLE